MKKLFYSQKLAPYVFILPFVLTVIFFWAVPIANGVLLSFQDVLQDKWVGLDNYKRLLSDKIFLKALANSTRYMIGTLVLLIPFPMFFATLLNSKLMKKPGFFKSIYFLPALTSVVVAGTIFRLMFGEMETSLANQVIGMFGLGPIKWLKNDLTGYFALLLLACWRWTGVNILYFLAGLQSISTDLYEAASIDGANKWQIFWKITMPYVLFICGPSLIQSVIANINNFNVIYLLTGSTTTSNMAFANSNAKETDLLITWLFTLTNDNSNYKMASVIGIISFVICALLTLLSYTRMISGDKEEVYQ